MDAGFDPAGPSTEFGGHFSVSVVAVEADGKIVIGGQFDQFNGVQRDGIARLNPDGSLDTSFGFDDPGRLNNSLVGCLAIQTDGKIVIGGQFRFIYDTARNDIARLNPDGSLDTRFDPGSGTDDTPTSVAIQTDGKVLISGFFSQVNGVPRSGIARLNANGSLDMNFNPVVEPPSNEPYVVAGVVVQTDGKVVLGGAFSKVNGVTRNSVARLNGDPTGSTPASQLLNIATRLKVLNGDNVLIGGFIITGTDPKKVLILGIGPSLAQFFSGSLSDPTLELYQGNTLLQTNDNWKTDQQAEVEATGAQPSNELESAIVRTLDPGNYTAILRGKGDTTGIGVVQAYDLNQAANSKFGNIATRGFVDSGDNVMIGGFIIGPANGGSTTVVVRAIGPSLTNFGVSGALPDPTVELHDGNGATIAFNDNWADDANQGSIPQSLKPGDQHESALYRVLPPGDYTAIMRGTGNSTGIGLVEVYNVQ